MAATEGFQLDLVVLAYDLAIVRRENFNDVNTRLLARVDFYRVADDVLLCSVNVHNSVINWTNGAYPIANKITQTKGITVMELG